MTQLAALNVKISGDSSDLQSDLAQAKTQLNSFEASAGTATKRTAGFTGSLGKLGNVSGQTRAQIQNASFQLQDIAVQLQGGTKASTVFAQQLPQLLGGFGALGAVAGVLAGVGIPALAFAFSALGEDVVTLEDRLSELKDIQDGLKSSTEILEMSVDELREKYGAAAETVRQFAIAQARARVAQAQTRLKDEVLLIGDVIRRYSEAVRVFDEFGESLDISNALANIRRDLSVNEVEAQRLFDAFQNLDSAQTFDQQQAALLRIDELLKASGVSAGDLPPELNKALIELRDLVFEANKLKAAMDRVAYPSGMLDQKGYTPETPDDDDTKRPRRAKSDPLKGELERLQERLMSEEELELASFERRQEILQQALERKLLTQQEYNELMEDAQAQHSDRMAQLDVYRYGTVLDQTGAFLGAMASAFQSGNNKMLRIAKVFGAAEALINSYRAYNQVIADPSLPWFAKIPAAVSVLGAGLNMVNAIKGVSSSGAAGAAGGAVGASGAAAQSAPQTSRNVAISLTGGDMFSRDQVIQLINGINEAVEDGAVVRLV